jgi:hypothetical protein
VDGVWWVGRLEADPVIEGGTCTLRVQRRGDDAREVQVTGDAMRICARLRCGATVAVEARSDGEQPPVVARIRAIRSRP